MYGLIKNDQLLMTGDIETLELMNKTGKYIIVEVKQQLFNIFSNNDNTQEAA